MSRKGTRTTQLEAAEVPAGLVRVLDLRTGHRYTVPASSFRPEYHELETAPAVDADGRPLRPEFAVYWPAEKGGTPEGTGTEDTNTEDTNTSTEGTTNPQV